MSIEDLQAGDCRDLLTQADVVIAVDATAREEEVVSGRYEWQLANRTGQQAYLTVLRVELDMESDDLDWLSEILASIEAGNVEGDDDQSGEREGLDE
jgi:hypothetical protein